MTSLPPILLVENDANLAGALVALLGTHGLLVHVARHPFDAIPLLRNDDFSLVVTDYRFGPNEDPEQTAVALLERAGSMPIGCITGSELPRHLRRRYAFVLGKPFTIEQLLINVAPWAAVQKKDEKSADIVAAYFSYLSSRDWDAVVELCAPSVEYNPPPGAPWRDTIRGRAAFRRHTEEVFSSFPDARFELLQILWLPRGVVARFRSTWRASSLEKKQEGAILFGFEANTIAKIGVDLHSPLWL